MARQAEKTKQRIIDAYYFLTKQTGRTVSVSAICDYLGIYRSTFYNYFTSIDELEEEINRMLLCEKVHRPMEESKSMENFRKMITQIAQNSLANKHNILSLMHAGIDNSFSGEFKATTYTNVKKYFSLSDSLHDTLLLTFLAEGLSSTLLRWLESGDENVDAFVDLVCETVRTLLNF